MSDSIPINFCKVGLRRNSPKQASKSRCRRAMVKTMTRQSTGTG